MRRAARVDSNHSQIVQALRQVGASVQDLSGVGQGCPDLLVGFRRRSYPLEIKDGAKAKSARRLTPDEEVWHRTWAGDVYVVESVEDALRVIGAI